MPDRFSFGHTGFRFSRQTGIHIAVSVANSTARISTRNRVRIHYSRARLYVSASRTHAYSFAGIGKRLLRFQLAQGRQVPASDAHSRHFSSRAHQLFNQLPSQRSICRLKTPSPTGRPAAPPNARSISARGAFSQRFRSSGCARSSGRRHSGPRSLLRVPAAC